MMRVEEILEQISVLQQSDLATWISEELISPQEEAGALLFSDMECARIRLMCTLRYELEIDTDTLAIILSLIDQLYDTRRRLLSLTAAVAAQDKTVKSAILAAINQNAGLRSDDRILESDQE
jgi:chaperone modulatory protein CbpM